MLLLGKTIMTSGTDEHTTKRFRNMPLGAHKIPLARAGTPEDCAGAYVFLLSSLSSCIAVDGGLTATY
jgi:NAD(P)-dependent dehydrogenase (short-subunit alcohol dehydrogenase family)